MKKHILLGLAALAAMGAVATTAQAGEVKLGGSYRFQLLDEDGTIRESAVNTEDFKTMRHQLVLKMDMKTSEKTAAHMVWYTVDDQVVQGSGSSFLETRNPNTQSSTVAGGNWEDIRQLWLETEAFGVGVKAGEMPIQLNDNILVNDDGDSSFGAIVLSKTFGGITAVLADVRVLEGNAGNAQGANAATQTGGRSAVAFSSANPLDSDEDDIDLYVAALMGKAGNIEWNTTLAYADVGKAHGNATATGGVGAATFQTNNSPEAIDNWWLAATLGTKLGPVDMKGTLIYEAGYDGIRQGVNAEQNQLEGSGWMGALRLTGNTGFGGWNGYGFYGSEDFDSVSNRPNWSKLYDSPASDLMHIALTSSQFMTDAAGNKGISANDSGENAWGLGAGLSVKAGAWTISPGLDYVAVTEDSMTVAGIERRAQVESAWGTSLALSTEVSKDATLTLYGAYVDPEDGDSRNENTITGNAGKTDNMHTLSAELSIAF